MDKDKLLKIIEKLIEDTKNKNITWKRIIQHNDFDNINRSTDNSFLLLHIRNYTEDIASSNVILDNLNSYFTLVNKGYFYLLHYKDIYDYTAANDEYDLAFQSSEFAKVQSFNVDTKDILRLKNIVENYIDNNEDFLNSFLDD